ncbi:phage/plasmid primase, P4 family [Pandoraea sp. B-6]|uniref:phage/plasmid primase, P4 family n=1 Tax=Pandoraea sp. B-6 TaxID=1204340 RepID=UPI0003455EE6|nr:phage/plasmid primase, P4 family [Pandoraea sp. B-6]
MTGKEKGAGHQHHDFSCITYIARSEILESANYMKPTKTTNCNIKAMTQHLKAVASPSTDGTRCAAIQVFPERDGSNVKSQSLYLEATRETAIELAALNERGAAIAVVPQRTDGQGRRSENITRIRYLVADCDSGQTRESLAVLPVQPDILVETSAGRFHAYFRVKCERSKFRELSLALANALKSDPNSTDAAHAFRLAGTINWKRGQRTKLRKCGTGSNAGTAAELIEALGGQIPATETPVTARPIRKRGHKIADQKPSADEVRELLARIPAQDRTVWLHIGMAVHSWDDNAGFEIWDQWSRSAPEKYDEARQKSTWANFDLNGTRTIRTIYYYANQYGTSGDASGRSSFPTSDADVAKFVAVKLGENLKIVENESCRVFIDHHWSKDKRAAIRSVLSEISELVVCAEETGNSTAASILKRMASYQSAQRILTGMQAFPELDAKASDFDTDPYLLGVPNGVVDLRTKEFRAGRPQDMITCTTDAKFDPTARCPQFAAFLQSVAPDRVLRRFLRSVLGYSMTGLIKEQKAFFMLGRGSNGKGTLTRAIENVVGPFYSGQMSPSFLKGANKGNANGPTPALMALQRPRILFCTESERRGGIDEPFFKQLTGGDQVSGRHNYGETESFRPRGKLLLSTNEMPDWDRENDALWRRVMVIPFTQKFSGASRDNDLDDKLATEASGILNWLIAGASDYLQAGRLPRCAQVEAATSDARTRADSVRMWIDAECKRSANGKIAAQDAFDAYSRFTGRHGVEPVTIQKFKLRMVSLGFKQKRINRGNQYVGVRLINF